MTHTHTGRDMKVELRSTVVGIFVFAGACALVYYFRRDFGGSGAKVHTKNDAEKKEDEAVNNQ